MSNSNWLYIVVIIIAVALFGGWYISNAKKEIIPPPVAMTTPPVIATTTVPRATYKNADADKIVVTAPLPGATVGNTFAVTGRARGGWYFEASFPLTVISATGTMLVQMPVQADGEWMTAAFVPFATTTVSVPAYYKGAATLILKNDNPSGLPENDASISIPIVIQ